MLCRYAVYYILLFGHLNWQDMVYHDAVRLLLRRKWKVFAGQVFL